MARSPAPGAPDVGEVVAAPEPRNATVAYPGGLRARWRWGGSGSGPEVFALSESGGTLVDFGSRVAKDPDALCRAELRLEGPRGAWTARFASLIHDEPRGLLWDTAGPARRRVRLPYLRTRGRDRRGPLGPPFRDAGRRADRFLPAGPRPRPVRARNVRPRAGRHRRLADRSLRRRHRSGTRRRTAGARRALAVRSAHWTRQLDGWRPDLSWRAGVTTDCGQTVDNLGPAEMFVDDRHRPSPGPQIWCSQPGEAERH